MLVKSPKGGLSKHWLQSSWMLWGSALSLFSPGSLVSWPGLNTRKNSVAKMWSSKQQSCWNLSHCICVVLRTEIMAPLRIQPFSSPMKQPHPPSLLSQLEFFVWVNGRSMWNLAEPKMQWRQMLTILFPWPSPWLSQVKCKLPIAWSLVALPGWSELVSYSQTYTQYVPLTKTSWIRCETSWSLWCELAFSSIVPWLCWNRELTPRSWTDAPLLFLAVAVSDEFCSLLLYYCCLFQPSWSVSCWSQWV